MTDIQTLWEDSGFDCPHCGGVIDKRIDRQPDKPKEISYQCRRCECQWSTVGTLLRVGREPACRLVAQGAPVAEPVPQLPLARPAAPARSVWPRFTWRLDTRLVVWGIYALLALFVVLFLLRFAGGLVFRFFFPALIVVTIACLVVYLARQRRR